MPVTFEDVYEELEDFVHWLAWRKRTNVWLMDQQEIEGELFLELWRGFLYYQDDIDSLDNMCAVLRTMLDNRIADLYNMYTGTHRRHGNTAWSLEASADDGDTNDTAAGTIESEIINNVGMKMPQDPTQIQSSKERIHDVRSRLSGDTLDIFDALIYGHPAVGVQLELAGIRASHVYKGRGTIKPKARHVSEALGLPKDDVRAAFREIKRVYQEVFYGHE